MIILNNLVNTGQKMDQEKRWYTLVYKKNFKRAMRLLENKNKIRTIKAEINTKNLLSKFGKQKYTVINK